MSLSTNDAKKLKDLFDKYDDDHNGGLDIDEFKKFLTAVDEEFDDEDLNELYAVFDKNHDGLLSFDEFVDYVHCIETEDETALIEYRFKSIDTDGNGYLDPEELVEFAKLCGNLISIEDAKEMIAEMDIDKDGKLSLKDYLEASR